MQFLLVLFYCYNKFQWSDLHTDPKPPYTFDLFIPFWNRKTYKQTNLHLCFPCFRELQENLLNKCCISTAVQLFLTHIADSFWNELSFDKLRGLFFAQKFFPAVFLSKKLHEGKTDNKTHTHRKRTCKFHYENLILFSLTLHCNALISIFIKQTPTEMEWSGNNFILIMYSSFVITKTHTEKNGEMSRKMKNNTTKCQELDLK